MSIEDFVDSLENKDFVTAQAEFTSALSQKMSDALDQEKIAVAGAMFGEEEDNPDEVEWDESEEDDDDDDEE
jgi:hypothetical protein